MTPINDNPRTVKMTKQIGDRIVRLALEHLRKNGPSTAKQIAKTVGISPFRIGLELADAVDLGLIERGPRMRNARVFRLGANGRMDKAT